jgi:hypothetical protein
MVTEKMMEDAISSDPEKYLGEKGLKLIARQYSIGNYVFDLLFEDKRGSKLIVELQKGTLDRNHTYKILDYYDEYKEKNPTDFIELMIIANRIPHERRRRLEAHGISWKEIPEFEFIGKNDIVLEDNKCNSLNVEGKNNKKEDKIDDINYEKYYAHLIKYNEDNIVEGIREFINELEKDEDLILQFKKGSKVELNLNICLKNYRPKNTFIGLTSSARGFFAWPWFKLLENTPAETKVREIFGERNKSWMNIKPNNYDELKELFNKIEESIRVVKEMC